jgi:hypothetical protein
MTTEFNLTIETNCHYGKLFGGPTYAGWPITYDIKIKIGNHMYLEHYIYIYLTEELDYIVCFNNECIPEIRLSDIEFRKKIEVDSSDNALDMTFGIQYVTENTKNMFVLGGLTIEVNDTTETAIKQFVKDYRLLLIDFQKAVEELMQNRKKTFNPQNNKTGYYK